MNYSEQLKDPRWQKMRLQIMERDGWKCVECGNDKKTLHVHHKKYIKDKKPWEYDDENLQTLCADCHNDNHLTPIEVDMGRGIIDPKEVINAFPFFNVVFSKIYNHKGNWELTLRENNLKRHGLSMYQNKYNFFRCVSYLIGYAWFDCDFMIFDYDGRLHVHLKSYNNDWIYNEVKINYKNEIAEGYAKYLQDHQPIEL